LDDVGLLCLPVMIGALNERAAVEMLDHVILWRRVWSEAKETGVNIKP
jgi:hypothetical protein